MVSLTLTLGIRIRSNPSFSKCFHGCMKIHQTVPPTLDILISDTARMALEEKTIFFLGIFLWQFYSTTIETQQFPFVFFVFFLNKSIIYDPIFLNLLGRGVGRVQNNLIKSPTLWPLADHAISLFSGKMYIFWEIFKGIFYYIKTTPKE